MAIINPISVDKAQGAVKDTLNAVKAKLGGSLPNMFGVFANSPAALDGYMGLSAALGKGRLSAKQREAIAIAVAGDNGCDYCLSAHSLFGGKAGMEASELTLAQSGKASDARTQAMLDLALEINKSHGKAAGAAACKARSAGLSEEEILEVAANVAINVLTNTVNGLAETEVDFPKVALSHAA